jgi:hypothetical protein
VAAYGDGVQAPFISSLWQYPVWFLLPESIRRSAAYLINIAYVNRKYHSGSATYWTWRTDNDPDPAMANTTPPHPKNEYTDHVIIQVIEAA